MAKIDYEISGVDNLIEWFDERKGHYFMLFKGSQKIETGDCESREDCRDILLGRLARMQREGNETTLTLKLYKKKGRAGIDEKDYDTSINFVVCKPQQFYPQPYYQAPQQNTGEIEALKARIAALELELNAEEEEEGEEIGAAESPVQAAIVGMLNNPNIQQALLGALMGAFAPQGKPRAMAGTGTRDEALDILSANGVTDDDLMLLAQMAINNPAQFKMLLKMLRNQ